VADQLEGARSLPVKFRDQGDGSAADLLELVNPAARPVPLAQQGAVVLPAGAASAAKQAIAQARLELLATGPRPVQVRALLAGTLTAAPDRGAATFSGSHTTSGTPSTSTQVRPANAARKDIEIANISDTTVYLGFGGAAVTEAGIPLYAGSSYYSERSTEQINSICTVASKKLTVLER